MEPADGSSAGAQLDAPSIDAINAVILSRTALMLICTYPDDSASRQLSVMYSPGPPGSDAAPTLSM
jgi:hypothetical protein